jgi:hypothetical protein
MDGAQGCTGTGAGEVQREESLGVAAFTRNRVTRHAGAVFMQRHQVLRDEKCDGEEENGGIHCVLLSVVLREWCPTHCQLSRCWMYEQQGRVLFESRAAVNF